MKQQLETNLRELTSYGDFEHRLAPAHRCEDWSGLAMTMIVMIILIMVLTDGDDDDCDRDDGVNSDGSNGNNGGNDDCDKDVQNVFIELQIKVLTMAFTTDIWCFTF